MWVIFIEAICTFSVSFGSFLIDRWKCNIQCFNKKSILFRWTIPFSLSFSFELKLKLKLKLMNEQFQCYAVQKQLNFIDKANVIKSWTTANKFNDKNFKTSKRRQRVWCRKWMMSIIRKFSHSLSLPDIQIVLLTNWKRFMNWWLIVSFDLFTFHTVVLPPYIRAWIHTKIVVHWILSCFD